MANQVFKNEISRPPLPPYVTKLSQISKFSQRVSHKTSDPLKCWTSLVNEPLWTVFNLNKKIQHITTGDDDI